jgi:hypothetical protein
MRAPAPDTEKRQASAPRLGTRSGPSPFARTMSPAGKHAGNLAVQRAAIQRKAAVSAPTDAYEEEADRLSAFMMRTDPVAEAPCACGGTCASCASKHGHGVQLKRSASGPAPAEVPSIVQESVRASGHPLDPASRAFFEPRFGTDLGDVRVHTDSQAAAAARALHADAFTFGSDVVFARGRYQPHSDDGRRLLAHELVHVQQQSSGVSQVQRQLEPVEPNVSEIGIGPGTEPLPEELFVEGGLAALEDPGAAGEGAAGGGPAIPPDVARRITYATTVLRNVLPLPEDDRASLEKIIPGTPILARIKQRDEKRKHLEVTTSTIASFEHQQSYSETVMEDLHMAAERLPREIETLDAEIQAELTALGTNEKELVDLVESRFPRIWVKRAKEIAYTMLDENERVAKYERERYSQQVCSPDTVGLQDADRQLAKLFESIPADEYALQKAAAYRSTIPAGTEPRTAEELGIPENESSLIVYVYNYAEYSEKLQLRKEKYEAARSSLIAEFPILGADNYVPGMFMDVSEDRLGEVVGEPIDEILENIEDTRENIADDTIFVWDLTDVPGLAFQDLGVTEDSVLGDAVRSYIEDKKSDESWLDIALAAISIVAGLVAVFATGGLALVAGGIALAAGGVSLYRSASKYMSESAAEKVALDPVIADISVNEPEILWVVLDVIGLGLDVADFIKVIRPAARAFMASKDIETFASEAHRLVPDHADRIIMSARGQLLERAGREIADDADLVASAGQKAARNLSPDELDAELRAVARGEPEQLAAGDEYLMQISVPDSPHKWRLRRDGVWCRFSTAEICLVPTAVPPRMRAVTVEGGKVSAARVREVLAELQKEYPILKEFPLNTAAIQRVMAKGPLVDGMKGQLLEELLAVRVRKALRSKAGRASLGVGEETGKVVFIEGWRVTDAAGRPFTDGILAVERGGKLEILTVLEAKSGARSAEGLARDVESVRSMSRPQRIELFRYIRDEYRVAVGEYIRKVYPQHFEAYRAAPGLARTTGKLPFTELPDEVIIDVATHPSFRRGTKGAIFTSGQGGQVTRDVERAFEGGIRIDGAEKVIPTTAGPQSTRFIGAVPEDVDTNFIQSSLGALNYNVDIMRFGISQDDIVNLATELAARITAAAK